MIFNDMDSHRQVSNYMDNVDILTFEAEPHSVVSSISNVNELLSDSKKSG